MRKVIAVLAALFAGLLLSIEAGAACPVGKREGSTWCKNGMEWKCEKCGSEYCEIMTGRRCVKDDRIDDARLTPLQKLLLSMAR